MKQLIGLLIICSTMFCDITVVASDGDNLNSNVSSKASRCNYYILIDANGNRLETMQNPHKDVMGGASSHLINMLESKKVSHIIASDFGGKLTMSLESNSIKYTIYKGNINGAIENIIKK